MKTPRIQLGEALDSLRLPTGTGAITLPGHLLDNVWEPRHVSVPLETHERKTRCATADEGQVMRNCSTELSHLDNLTGNYTAEDSHTRNTAGLGESCKTQEIPVKEMKSHCRSKIPNPSLSYYLPLTAGGNGLGGYHRDCLTGWISWRSSVSLKAFNTLDTEIQLIELLGLGQIKVDIYLISRRAIYEQIFIKISLL